LDQKNLKRSPKSAHKYFENKLNEEIGNAFSLIRCPLSFA